MYVLSCVFWCCGCVCCGCGCCVWVCCGVVRGCVVVLCMCVCYRDLMTLAIERPGYEDDGDDDYDV